MEVLVLGGFVGLLVVAAVVALMGVGPADARTHAEEIRSALASAGLELVEVRVPGWLAGLAVPAPRSGQWRSADGAVRAASLIEGDRKDHVRHRYLRVTVLDRDRRSHEVVAALVYHHGALLSVLFDRPLDRLDDEV